LVRTEWDSFDPVLSISEILFFLFTFIVLNLFDQLLRYCISDLQGIIGFLELLSACGSAVGGAACFHMDFTAVPENQ